MRYVTLNEDGVVISVRIGNNPVGDEMHSSSASIGQVMQPDGSFIYPVSDPVEHQPTPEDMQMQTLLNTEYLVIMSELTNL